MSEPLTVEKVVERFYNGEPAKTTKRPNTENERSVLLFRATNKMALLSELGRMVRDCINDPVERERCYWRLIESVDFSDAWHDKNAKRKLGPLLQDLRYGPWKDIEDKNGK